MRTPFLLAALAGAALLASGCGVGPTYSQCFGDSECQVGEFCIPTTTTSTTGRQCSFECTSSASCPSSGGQPGRCFSINGMRSICYQECISNASCYSNNVCVDFRITSGSGGMTSLCVPTAG